MFLADARRIRDLFGKARAIKFVDWLVSWTEDLDETIWWGEQFARAASSHPRFTELAWLAGFAESGKDLLVSILQDRGCKRMVVSIYQPGAEQLRVSRSTIWCGGGAIVLFTHNPFRGVLRDRER